MRRALRKNAITARLKEFVAGEVLAGEEKLLAFSHDQSIYEVQPAAVVVPADRDDLRKLMAFAFEEGIPITPRGGGSGTAGSALGEGIVIEYSGDGHFCTITDFAVKEQVPFVRAGAGVFHNEVQDYLRRWGYFLPADVSSARWSKIGGNIATKASGPHALKHGSIDRFLDSVEFFTDRGELVNTAIETTIPLRLKRALQELNGRILADKVTRRFLEARRSMKTASGYNMFAFLEEFPVAKLITQLFAGSVGTLGVITQATLRGAPYDTERATALLYFNDLAEAGRAVLAIRETGVAAIEIMNKETVRIINNQAGDTAHFPGDAHLLLIEFEGEDQPGQIEQVKGLIRSERLELLRDPVVATSPEEMNTLWDLRKMILPFLYSAESTKQALSVVNDVGVDPSHLVTFIKDLEKVFARHNIETIIYGHAGSGNLHLRPLFDLTRPDLRGFIKRLADDVYTIVFRYGGTISAEHGMGRLRAPYLRREWGEQVYAYMQEVKNIFDPQGLLNPEVMFSERSITDNMRNDLLIH